MITLNVGRESYEPRIDTINKKFEIIQTYIERWGFPRNVISREITYSGSTAYININEKLLSNLKNAIELGANIEDTKIIYDLANFLEEKFGVQFGGIIEQKKAEKMTGKSNVNAFI